MSAFGFICIQVFFLQQNTEIYSNTNVSMWWSSVVNVV